MAEPTITVEIDTEIGAAYIGLSDHPVVRTEEYSDEITVDLDELGMAVGIEVLDLAVPVPLDDLVARHHIESTTLARLLASLTLQPSAGTTIVSGSAASGSRRQPTRC